MNKGMTANPHENELSGSEELAVDIAAIQPRLYGFAEIDFFCGATLMIEGPAKLELESDWSVRFLSGRLRANVPPAARGFAVKAAGSEIVDLGTEFALEVNPENARVEVLDGEVKLLGGDQDGNHLTTGQGRWLRGAEGNQGDASLDELSTIDLNGTIDELAIFDAALDAGEVLNLYEQGKPLGY